MKKIANKKEPYNKKKNNSVKKKIKLTETKI